MESGSRHFDLGPIPIETIVVTRSRRRLARAGRSWETARHPYHIQVHLRVDGRAGPRPTHCLTRFTAVLRRRPIDGTARLAGHRDTRRGLQRLHDAGAASRAAPSPLRAARAPARRDTVPRSGTPKSRRTGLDLAAAAAEGSVAVRSARTAPSRGEPATLTPSMRRVRCNATPCSSCFSGP